MMPFIPFWEDSLKMLFTSSLVVGRLTSSTISTTETLGVGTRRAMPLSLPFIGG